MGSRRGGLRWSRSQNTHGSIVSLSMAATASVVLTTLVILTTLGYSRHWATHDTGLRKSLGEASLCAAHDGALVGTAVTTKLS